MGHLLRARWHTLTREFTHDSLDRSWHARCCTVSLMRIAGFLACLFALAFVPLASTAHACGGYSCAPERFLPFEGDLPANAPGVLWLVGHQEDAIRDTRAEELSWTCVTGDQEPRPIAFHAESLDPQRTFEQLLVADEPLVAGDRCEIAPSFELCNMDSEEPYLSSRTSFVITEAAPLPTVLGSLRAQLAAVTGVSLSTTSGECSIAHEACGAMLELELSDEAAPWADVLQYDTHVDDESWGVAPSLNVPAITGGSHIGRGVDRIFVGNAETDGVGLAAEGVHSVVMRATVPGASSIETDATTIDLTCASVAPLQPDAGEPDPAALDDDASTAAEDASTAAEDASTPAEDEAAPVADAAGVPVSRQSNCGCSVPGHRSTTRFGAIVLALAMVVGARRLRRSQ